MAIISPPMITVIACPDATYASYLANKAIKKDFPVRDETNFINFNMAVTTPLELAREAEFLPLGTDKKAIIADNCEFLIKPARGSKKEALEGLDDLLEYCRDPSPYTDLYFLVYDEKVDEKNPLIEAIKANGKIVIEKAPDEALMRAQMKVFLEKRGTTIDEDAANELFARVGDNYARFGNELKKLSIYANGEPIRLDAVKMLVSKKIDDNIFAMSEALLADNVSKAFEVYYDLKVSKMDEIPLIGMLSTSFRFLDQVAYLDDCGRSKAGIAAELGVKEWRVGKNLQTLLGVKRENIAIILEELYKTSMLILTGAAQPEFAFTHFLANFHLKR